MSVKIVESVVIEGTVEDLWEELRRVDFRWLRGHPSFQKCERTPIKLVGDEQETSVVQAKVGDRRNLVCRSAKDSSSSAQLRITEYDEKNHRLAYEVVACDSPAYVVGTTHTIQLSVPAPQVASTSSSPNDPLVTLVEAEGHLLAGTPTDLVERSRAAKMRIIHFLRTRSRLKKSHQITSKDFQI